MTRRVGVAVLLSLGVAACGAPAASPAPRSSPAATPTHPVPSATSCSTASVLSLWTSRQLAAQTVVVPVDEGSVQTVTSEVAGGAGGVILFGSSAPPDLGTRLQQLTAVAPNGIKPFVMSDEEGGVVQRMPNLVGTMPSARQMGATMTPAQIQELAAQVAAKLRSAGVTMDLAPVLDTDNGAGPNNRDPDGTRSFSNDPATASAAGRAFAAGLMQGGVVPVIKHFPGLGHATGNTDVESAATLPWSELQTGGVVPFRDAIAARIPAVMIANATVPGVSSVPASVSPDVLTTVLRTQLGFQGLVMTDSLSGVALRNAGYTVPAASAAAIEAGADMVLFNADPAQTADMTDVTITAIAAAADSGALPRTRLFSAVSHILSAKGIDPCAGAAAPPA